MGLIAESAVDQCISEVILDWVLLRSELFQELSQICKFGIFVEETSYSKLVAIARGSGVVSKLVQVLETGWGDTRAAGYRCTPLFLSLGCWQFASLHSENVRTLLLELAKSSGRLDHLDILCNFLRYGVLESTDGQGIADGASVVVETRKKQLTHVRANQKGNDGWTRRHNRVPTYGWSNTRFEKLTRYPRSSPPHQL